MPTRFTRTFLTARSLVALILLAGSCTPMGHSHAQKADDHAPKLLSVSFGGPVSVSTSNEAVTLGSARNETVSFVVQIDNLPRGDEKAASALRLQPLKIPGGGAADDRIEASQFTPYQLLFMPVDLNRAAFVRHTGLEQAATESLPRALFPAKIDKNKIDLAALRNPDQPRNPAGRALTGSAKPLMLWFDLAVPPTAKPGDYQTTLEVVVRNAVVSTLLVNLHVNDFVLPDERHLQMVGRLDWPALRRLYPAIFETARPSLMKRGEPQVAQAVAVLDALVKLGQQHRAQVVIPELKPVVKWPAGQPPVVDWDDFDSLVMPWLSGDAFPDRVPLGYWPLPEAASLRNFNLAARVQYWAAASAHFAGANLLNHSPIVVQKEGTDPRISPGDWFRLSDEAARLLAVNSAVRVNVPLEDDQVQFLNDANSQLVDPKSADRLITAAPGLVYREAAGNWPKGTPEPSRWLAADKPGLVPFAGAGGDERDVRLWATLAFLRKAELVQWPNTLPNYDDPEHPTDPDEVIWFYPGQWFGVDEPVPTVHLKWIRRAQQDYEYLFLAKARGEYQRTFVIARLITKPVVIPIAQIADPAYALLCGSTGMKAWQEAKQLLAESILLRPPGVEKDPDKDTELNGRTLQWAVPQEKPVLLARKTTWGWAANQANGPTIDLRLGADIYNASDKRLMGTLQWSTAADAWAPGWQINPKPTVINPASAINTYHARRFDMDVEVKLNDLTAEPSRPLPLNFTEDLSGQTQTLQSMTPVAFCDHRNNAPLQIDGDLKDWSQADMIQNGPLVRMLNRPEVQRQQIDHAATATQIYTGWAADRFYVAFGLRGCQVSAGGGETNYVDYPLGRAWGADVAEILVQAIYVDGSAGPVLHVVVKPRGALLVERKAEAGRGGNPWESVAGEQVLYGSTVDVANPAAAIWRGEIAVPWSAINDAKHAGAHPTLLRFNFAQHKNATGESASWAGPIDSGRDENFTGLLYLRDPQNLMHRE